MTQHDQLPPNYLRFLIVTLLVLSLFFRFAGLDKKVYWEDETYTSLRISGYDERKVTRQLFNGQVISVNDLHKYQQLSPEKSLIDTANVLATRPEHPPLYYVMARFWAQGFGSSVMAMRSLPALISLLVFPCIYWLCLELFESSIVGWFAVALVAGSPIYVWSAQQARQYSLWTVLILLSSAALLRAIRLEMKRGWKTYAATVAIGLYSHLFFGFVLIGQGIYVVAIEGCRLSKTVRAYLLASGLGILAFTPWLWLIVNEKFSGRTSWLSKPLLFSSLVKIWSFNLCQIFVSEYLNNDSLIYFFIPILALVLSSIYWLCNQTPKRVWLFILTLMGVTALALVIPDLIWGGWRSGISRYLFPCYLGIQLAVAYLLATQISSICTNSTNTRWIKFWQIVMVVLISGEILSCAISFQSETWCGRDEFTVQASRIINQSLHPLVISDNRLSLIMPLSYRLNPKVRFLLVVEPNRFKIPDSFTNVFLFDPSKRLLSKFFQAQDIQVELVENLENRRLWELK